MNTRNKSFYYSVKITTQDITKEKNQIDTYDFPRDYLFHSQKYALVKFKKGLKAIDSGYYLETLPGLAQEFAIVDIGLYLVEEMKNDRKEYILKDFKKTFQDNLKMAKSIMDQEMARAAKEKLYGFVRHSLSIQPNYFFRLKEKFWIEGVLQYEGDQDFSAKNSGSFETAMSAAELSYYRSLEKGNEASLVNDHHVSVELMLVDGSPYKDIEYSMYYYEEKNEFIIAFAEELRDKAALEKSAYYTPITYSPVFDSRPSLWEIESRNPLLESGKQEVIYRVTEDLVEAETDLVSDSFISDFKEEEKILFDVALEAKKFYRDRLASIKRESESVEPQEYFKNIKLSIIKDGEEHQIFELNAEIFCEGTRELEALVLRQRRESLNNVISVNDEDYRVHQHISMILETLDFTHYCVFEGSTFEASEKRKRFFHHDLGEGRKQAISFFNQLLREREQKELDIDSEASIAVVLHKSSWRDTPFYIKSTAPSCSNDLRIGLLEEAKVYRRLGFSTESLI